VAGEDLEQTILFRRAMYDGYRDVSPPHELGGGVTQATPGADLAERGGALTGLGCSPGVVEGCARVIMSLDRTGDLRPGDILVTRFTDPGWTPALGLVAGVVTEVGGMLSHGAVIGREYGIPAVLNVQGATSALRSGQRIRIDGAAGTVELLHRGEQAGGSRVEGGTHTGFGRSPQSTAAKDHADHALHPRAGGRLPEGKRFLCVAGGDGSGKTTQVARLAAAFESEDLSVAPVTIWDAFLDPKIASRLPFRKPSEVYGYLAMLDPVSRTHFLFHALHLALDLAAQRDADVVVANAYWYKYVATEVAHGGDPATLRRLTAGFPEPDLTFYLSITPEQSLARKVQRSDYESGYGQGDRDFVDFQQRTQDVLEGLSSELGWIVLDGDSPVRDITAAMVERLKAVQP
jgi:thymidylate kinase/phosphohistidine swiveling domain-containing protein